MTVYTSANEVQTAMYNMLMPAGSLDATLAGLGLNAVYDFAGVPQNATFDYMTIGEGYESPNDTLGDSLADGYYYYAMLTIFSRQRGTANIDAMVSRLDQLFHRQSLTLATLKHVYTLRQRVVRGIDPSGTIPILKTVVTYKVYSSQS